MPGWIWLGAASRPGAEMLSEGPPCGPHQVAKMVSFFPWEVMLSDYKYFWPYCIPAPAAVTVHARLASCLQLHASAVWWERE